MYFRLIICTLLCIILTKPAYANLKGRALIDSLKTELNKSKEDTIKIKILSYISYESAKIDLDEGIKYGRQDSALAAQIGWKKGIAVTDNFLGNVYQVKGQNALALPCFLKVLKIYEEAGLKERVGTIANIVGNIYINESYYPKALEYYFKSLKIGEEMGNKPLIGGAACNIGIIYHDQGDNAKALEYYFKSLQMGEETGNKILTGGLNCNIGIVYQEEKDYSKALEYFFKALKIDEETGTKQYINIVTGDIGDVYYEEQDYLQAVAWHFKALRMFDDMDDKNNKGKILGCIGNDYIAIIMHPQSAQVSNGPDSMIPQGRDVLLHKAIEYFNKAVVLEIQNGNIEDMSNEYSNLAIADSLLGDYQGAYVAHVQYSIFKDSVFNKDNSVKIAKLEMHQKISEDSLNAAQEMQLKELKYEYEKKQAAAKTEKERQVLLYEEEMKRQKINYEFAQKQTNLEAEQKRKDAVAKAEQEKKDVLAKVKLQRQKSFTYAGLAGILALLTFSFFIVKERKKSDKLLLNILPSKVASELKKKGYADAQLFDMVTVLFTDFVSFTKVSERLSPQQLVNELDTCFKAFDGIIGKHGIEKIKTVGDAYLAVCGLPTANSEHAQNMVNAAIEIRQYMAERKKQVGEGTFEIRLGVHSGSVVAGIVGIKKYAYDIWGDTVNTAARMEQNSEAGKINISHTTYELVKDKFNCQYRGEVEAKNKGHLKMYYVN